MSDSDGASHVDMAMKKETTISKQDIPRRRRWYIWSLFFRSLRISSTMNPEPSMDREPDTFGRTARVINCAVVDSPPDMTVDVSKSVGRFRRLYWYGSAQR
mmetsp:Transcript_8171/g.14975  ORF Transcript_8171/g.14975 Transcript_8171/m.14975 type:complete len:101 (-) Transcript_8171:93-395(-)